MWLKILGLVAGGIAAALLVGTVAYLTIDALKRHLRQKHPNAIAAQVSSIIKSGNYNKINVNLYDNQNRHIDTEMIEAKDYDASQIREGNILYL